MPAQTPDSARYGLGALRQTSWLNLGIVVAAVAGTAGAFAYAGGWIAPQRLSQGRIIDRFEQVNGQHPGFRRNHAKGLCFAGWFDGNGEGERLSKAAVFRAERTPVFGRFALAGGQPYQADMAATVRSMAVNFALADGEIWRTGMNNIPVFPVRDAAGFYDQLAASKPDPATGKPDPARMSAFLAAHTEAGRALALIKAQAPTAGFADASYNSLNAFRFVAASGASTPVRWSMVADEPPQAPQPASAGNADPNRLFDALETRVERGPVRWHLLVTVGQPGDPTADATVPWPANRERLDVGILTVKSVQDEAEGDCRDVNFDPLLLPDGIQPSDDPLLSVRSAAYSESFTRRAGEPKSPSAIQLSANAGGARP
ncbi:catalase family peroxidase [Azospirillum rugosum]|uniref:Catalase-related peroxidase n=1 Tax=Azospirillum rugosum TaxID=416170 RepID=A0ABS4SM36_9PROT|nr:catalase family peroxidase [Azospirillum rugosum]MBP2293628.1 catalase [Azospirillum rugosum]MDQ0527173.1 catalase [Azospirillum rugosum]